MIVTKRGLVKVIILLAIVDFIAGLWYLTLRIENSGTSRDLWEHTDSAMNADTIAEATVPDSFHIVTSRGYFISQQPLVKGDRDTYMASVKVVKARMPISVNGNDSVIALDNAVAMKALGVTAGDFSTALTQYMSEPHFNNGESHPFKKLPKAPIANPRYTDVQRIIVFPRTTSHRLLEVEIDKMHNNGVTVTETSAYVHYDRQAHAVLNATDVFNADDEKEILAKINAKIELLNKKEPKLSLRAVTHMPQEFNVRKDGIAFMYPPGEIAPLDDGETIILVLHRDLTQHYTPAFQRIVEASTGWWHFKKPSF